MSETTTVPTEPQPLPKVPTFCFFIIGFQILILSKSLPSNLQQKRNVVLLKTSSPPPPLSSTVWPEKNRQMSIKVAQK